MFGSSRKANIQKITLAALVLALLGVVFCSFPGTLAWLSGINRMQIPVDSGVRIQYFEQGAGTQTDPFVIHTPQHLYNLAWLQYLGKFDNKVYYFELCDGRDNKCVDESGTGIPSTGLDMTGWTLPPIGTESKPFTGVFNGNGKAITNLTVSNQTVTDKPSSVATYTPGPYIGVFGKIEGGTVSNVNLSNIKVSAADDTTATAGIAVGYVNGPISGIGVSSSTLEIGNNVTPSGLTANISDYTLVGYAAPAYRGTAGVAMRELDGPKLLVEKEPVGDSEAGLGTAWGDSIDMETMYGNLSSLKNSAVTNPITREDVTIVSTDGNDTVTSSITRGNGTLGRSRNNYSLVNYYGDNGGVSATFVNRTNTNNYLYLTEAEASKDVYSRTTIAPSGDEVYLSDASGNYVAVNGSSITVVSSQDAATKWKQDKAGTFYFEQDGQIYYLNCASDGTLYISDGQVTFWSIGKDTVSCMQGGVRKYLYCGIDGWTVTERITQFYITDGTNYLSVSSGDIVAIVNAENSSVASKWNTKDGEISINLDGTLWYLNYSNGLVMQTKEQNEHPTVWINDGVSMYCVIGDMPHYLVYKNGQWTAEVPKDASRKIKVGSNYMSINANGELIAVTDENVAAEWMFTYIDGAYLISATVTVPDGDEVQEVRYYLTTSDRTTPIAEGDTQAISTTTVENNAVKWKWDEEEYLDQNEYKLRGQIYYTRNNNQEVAPVRFLNYSGTQWQISVPKVYYTISVNDGSVIHYLTYVGGRNPLEDKTSFEDATWWDFQNHNSITAPSGTVYVKDTDTWLSYTKTTFIISWYTPGVNGENRLWTSDGESLRPNGDFSYVRFRNKSWGMSDTFSSLRKSYVDVTPVQDSKNLKVNLTEVPILVPEAQGVETDGIPAIVMTSTLDNSGVDFTYQGSRPAAATYFPLSPMENFPFAANPANTGYVISGRNDTTSAYQADIRVSRYGINSISTSTGSNNSYNAGTVKILACSSESKGDFRVVSGVTGNTTGIQIGTNRYDYVSPESMGFVCYEGAKAKLDELLTGKSNIYGLHFMNASINNGNKITATKATVNGVTYANYELPRDCIDVKLKTDGFITLFAGTYYSGNNTFFSIHKITRDVNDPRIITRIEPMTGTVNGYDMGWIMNNDRRREDDEGNVSYTSVALENNALYYFEIPVKAGEYAIGSVDGKTGAYLIYLDLSANQHTLFRDTVGVEDTTTVKLYEYPLGVDIIASPSDPIGVTPSAVISVPDGSQGNMTLERTGKNEVSYTKVHENMVSTYTAHLNTATSAEFVVDRQLSVFGSGLDISEYGTWYDAENIGKITRDNQYIEADVILKPKGDSTDTSKPEPNPVEVLTRTETTQYYNYYAAVDSNVIIKSTEDSPETTPLDERFESFNVYSNPVVPLTPNTLSVASYGGVSAMSLPNAARGARMAVAQQLSYTYIPATAASTDEEAGFGTDYEEEISAFDLIDEEEILDFQIDPYALEAAEEFYRSFQMQPERAPIPDYISLAPNTGPTPEDEPLDEIDAQMLDEALAEIPDEEIASAFTEELREDILSTFESVEPELLAHICRRVVRIQDNALRQDVINFLWSLAEEREEIRDLLIASISFLTEEEAEAFLPAEKSEPLPEFTGDLLSVFGANAGETILDYAPARQVDVYGSPITLNGERLDYPGETFGFDTPVPGTPAPLVYLKASDALESAMAAFMYTVPEGSEGQLAFDLGGGEVVPADEICFLETEDGIHYTAILPGACAPGAAYCAIAAQSANTPDEAWVHASIGIAPLAEMDPEQLPETPASALSAFLIVPTSTGGAIELTGIQFCSPGEEIGFLKTQTAPDLQLVFQECPEIFQLMKTDTGYALITDQPDVLTVLAELPYEIRVPEEIPPITPEYYSRAVSLFGMPTGPITHAARGMMTDLAVDIYDSPVTLTAAALAVAEPGSFVYDLPIVTPIVYLQNMPANLHAASISLHVAGDIGSLGFDLGGGNVQNIYALDGVTVTACEDGSSVVVIPTTPANTQRMAYCTLGEDFCVDDSAAQFVLVPTSSGAELALLGITMDYANQPIGGVELRTGYAATSIYALQPADEPLTMELLPQEDGLLLVTDHPDSVVAEGDRNVIVTNIVSEPEESEITEPADETEETPETEETEHTEEPSETKETEATEETSETEETKSTEDSSETEETESTEERSETEETEEAAEPEETRPPVWHTLYAKQAAIYFDGYADLGTPAKTLDVNSSLNVYQGMPTLRGDSRMPYVSGVAGQPIANLYLNQTTAMIFLQENLLREQNASITIRYAGGELAFDRGGGEICYLNELAGVQIIEGDYITAVIPATVENMRLAAYCSIDSSANIASASAEEPYAYVLVPACSNDFLKLERIELFSTDTQVGTIELRVSEADYFPELMRIFYHQRSGEPFSLLMENVNGRLTLRADSKDALTIFAFSDYTLVLPGDEETQSGEITEATEETTAQPEEITDASEAYTTIPEETEAPYIPEEEASSLPDIPIEPEPEGTIEEEIPEFTPDGVDLFFLEEEPLPEETPDIA